MIMVALNSFIIIITRRNGQTDSKHRHGFYRRVERIYTILRILSLCPYLISNLLVRHKQQQQGPPLYLFRNTASLLSKVLQVFLLLSFLSDKAHCRYAYIILRSRISTYRVLHIHCPVDKHISLLASPSS